MGRQSRIEVKEEPKSALHEYAAIPIAFEVRSILKVTTFGAGLLTPPNSAGLPNEQTRRPSVGLQWNGQETVPQLNRDGRLGLHSFFSSARTASGVGRSLKLVPRW